MEQAKRVFILGAGFSRPAGMPLATELLPLLTQELDLDELQEWLYDLGQRLAWLDGNDEGQLSFKLNIEQVFHYANFDIEVYRLRQQLERVGRFDGPGTAWNRAESISAWLSYLEDALRDTILSSENQADLTPITRWAKSVVSNDSVVTFNYDTLVERALAEVDKPWNHGLSDGNSGVAIYKLHGSIDWIVAHRSDPCPAFDLLFAKENANRGESNTDFVEDDYRLCRCRTREQLQRWVSGRDVQQGRGSALPRSVGVAGLGSYKQLHQIPGLGCVWRNAMRAIYEADRAIVIGFSMSDFDAMAQMQFGQIAKARHDEGRPLVVTVIDPYVEASAKQRFRRVFRSVDFVKSAHESIDWRQF